ncbi:unnamed protein product [Medioppia subpectinata]|uniref:Uncharacterized protein n=1 Tax=Medioppia subpectinata TaxID=1979941 RepID=A0A7R9L8V8_9ACAR|nr:unnamed protein product [Medioppia subpectinata]CAG2116928.1 unnamed protein product [Medioppia subpectinata]
MKCTGSQVEYIQLRNVTMPFEFTCNGYQSLVLHNVAYDILVDGQLEQMGFATIDVYFNILNGNIIEVNSGLITEGQCAGDTFFSANVYVTDDQYACAGVNGATEFTIIYIDAHVTGPKCGAHCTLDTVENSSNSND